jgi:hypothetical protein
MNKKRVVIFLIALILLVTMVSIASASNSRNFRAHLSGGEEVPAVDTQAQGKAIFRLSQDGSTLSYKLIAANIEDITQAHIHCGAAGTNGPVVLFLYPDGPPPQLIPGRFSGVLAEGTRTSADIIPRPDSPQCPGGIADLDDLIAKMASGDAYVNVHTVENPAGEIRGQTH